MSYSVNAAQILGDLHGLRTALVFMLLRGDARAAEILKIVFMLLRVDARAAGILKMHVVDFVCLGHLWRQASIRTKYDGRAFWDRQRCPILAEQNKITVANTALIKMTYLLHSVLNVIEGSVSVMTAMSSYRLNKDDALKSLCSIKHRCLNYHAFVLQQTTSTHSSGRSSPTMCLVWV